MKKRELLLGLRSYSRKRLHIYSQEYQGICPEARYSPWNSDREFIEIFNAIQSYSLVDVLRCYELWTLIESSLVLPGSVLEVGVWRGGTAALLAKRIRGRRKIFLADTFYGVVKTGLHDNRYRGGEHSDTSPVVVRELFASLQLGPYQLLEGIFPEETGFHLENERLCFTHVDVDAYQSAYDIVEWLWPRLSVGGVIVFDDYGFESCKGVRKMVDEIFPSSRGDAIALYNVNGHGIVIKRT